MSRELRNSVKDNVNELPRTEPGLGGLPCEFCSQKETCGQHRQTKPESLSYPKALRCAPNLGERELGPAIPREDGVSPLLC